MTDAKVIAEIGCNHKGDINVAKEMVEIAAIFSKVDIVKFQKRNNKELLSKQQYDAPHPNINHAYGDTYGEHREYLELDIGCHKSLKKWCERLGVIYSSSVWDLTSAKEIASLKPKLIKIPSACNINFEMLGWICDNFPGEIHISMGMTTRKEENEIITFLTEKRRNNDAVIYACTSGYPVTTEDVCLLEIERLRKVYGKRVKSIGFSGHHKGISLDIAAVTLGARFVERHFTLDRTWKGTDHAASLEPDGLRRLKRDIMHLQSALKYKKQEILDVEAPQRAKLKFKAIT